MVYITSRRAVRRTAADVEVKVYSNQPVVRLWVNGVDLGEQAVDGHVARWRVRLAPGANRVEARAGAQADEVEWNLAPGSH